MPLRSVKRLSGKLPTALSSVACAMAIVEEADNTCRTCWSLRSHISTRNGRGSECREVWICQFPQHSIHPAKCAARNIGRVSYNNLSVMADEG